MAVLEYLEKNQLVKEVEWKSVYLKKQLEKLKGHFSFIGDIRGKGLLLGIEFVESYKEKTPFSRAMLVTTKLVAMAKENGLLVYPAGAGIDGMNGDSITISPPLTITQEEMDELIQLLKRTFENFSEYLNNHGTVGDV